jgi:membrane protease YdiL (CAAX protease family)
MIMLVPIIVYLIGTVILYNLFDDSFKVHYWSYIISFIICAIAVYYFRFYSFLNLDQPNITILARYALLAIIYAVFIHFLESDILKSHNSISVSAIQWISVIILAPILEEFFFRGFAIEYLKKNGFSNWFIIVFTSLIFGLLHLPGIMQIHLFFMGAGLAVVYLKEKNIVYPIILHMIFNVIVLIW